jgi:hypothetical protein
MANLDLLLEAEKRGILPESKKPFLDEARKRGLIGGGSQEQEQVPSYDIMGAATGYTEKAPVSSKYDPVGVGTATAIMEPIYGLGEFIPGSIGDRSAAAAKELEKKYSETAAKYPIATRVGYGGTQLLELLTPGAALKGLGLRQKSWRPLQDWGVLLVAQKKARLRALPLKR